jgi:hypothetical protein
MDSDLPALANVGPAVARYFARIGITAVAQLPGQDPVDLYQRMSAAYGRRLDPCLLDTVMSAVDQAEGRPARPWWHYTPGRKRLLSGAGGRGLEQLDQVAGRVGEQDLPPARAGDHVAAE